MFSHTVTTSLAVLLSASGWLASLVSTTAADAASNHWAFTAPVRPAPPAVKNDRWVRNPVDRFVLARLEAEHLHPAPEADRATLIRRLSLDLTGLPPSFADVDAFLNDRSPDAYEKLVDRLLASPHYGEHQARLWLEAAQHNPCAALAPDPLWRYRDWVIAAFNRDLSFNEFVTDQLAGDLLTNPAPDRLVATGFNLLPAARDTSADPEQARLTAVARRVETAGGALLGLRLDCAQCHAHKTDPISQREYFQFFAFLNQDDPAVAELPDAAQLAQRGEILAQVAAVEDELFIKDAGLKTREAGWEDDLRDDVVEWKVLEAARCEAAPVARFTRLDDQSLLAEASGPDTATYNVTVKPRLNNITAFRLEALTDPHLPRHGPGRAADGNFVLTEFSVDAIAPDGRTTNRVALQNATADFEQPDFRASAAIDGRADAQHGWSVNAGPGRVNQDRKAVFETRQNLHLEEGSTLVFTLKQLYGTGHTLGRFRISATSQAEHPIAADPLPVEIRQIIGLPAAQRTPAQLRALFSFYRTVDVKCTPTNLQIDELMNGWPQPEIAPAIAVSALPRETRVGRNGDFRQPLETVSPGVPACLPACLPALPEGGPRDRLALARWLVDAKNPLTARVVVNRLWRDCFGRGIVMTTDDFGAGGARPSNPELLDWLACELMVRGWSVKAVQRLMVESAAYRQSSRAAPEIAARDPDNVLLARGPRFQMDAETLRDFALSAAGLLDPAVGGAQNGPDRRGLYACWRTDIAGTASTIANEPIANGQCTRHRQPDATPSVPELLGGPVFQRAAQALALRVWREGGRDDRERANFAFRLCTGRRPDAGELEHLLDLVKSKEDFFENRTAMAVRVAAPDPAHPPEDVNLHNVAAWTLAAKELLGLEDTFTRE